MEMGGLDFSRIRPMAAVVSRRLQSVTAKSVVASVCGGPFEPPADVVRLSSQEEQQNRSFQQCVRRCDSSLPGAKLEVV